MAHLRHSMDNTSELVDFGDDTSWLLAMLAEAGCAVSADTDLKNIFHDGVALAQLISHLTGIKIKVKKKARLPALQLDNLTVCCKALETVGLGDGIVPTDFRSGNMKTVTGFLAKLRIKYPGGMARQEVLLAEAIDESQERSNSLQTTLEEAREAESKMRRELAEVEARTSQAWHPEQTAQPHRHLSLIVTPA